MTRQRKKKASVIRRKSEENDYDRAFKAMRQRNLEDAIIAASNKLGRHEKLRRMGKTLKDVYVPKAG